MNVPPTPAPNADAETERLTEDAVRAKNWKRWGPYLPERQWATVREDYSANGDNWRSFPYEHSLGRAYRWGEDGLLGITDRQCRVCFAVALWNHADSHLKERLFGLTNPEGNHGEDVKEVYYYLDATPTASYLKCGYKYPQRAFPYEQLRAENHKRSRLEPEYELPDTGIFDDGRYFDVVAEYAKAGPDDILIAFTIHNRGPEDAPLTFLPTLWCRNTWAWGLRYEEGAWSKPHIRAGGAHDVRGEHSSLGQFALAAETEPAEWLFTENDTNPKMFGLPAGSGRYKDAFHHYIVNGNSEVIGRDGGTKTAAVYRTTVPAGGQVQYRFRLALSETKPEFKDFDAILAKRQHEANEFYANRIPARLTEREREVSRQAYAGLVYNNQFYHWVLPDWTDGDNQHPNPPQVVQNRANQGWDHLFSRDILSTPNKWEYPAFFVWDTAFHMVGYARIDPHFAKHQLLVLLREWYLHPNGQIPAYEYDLSNVNPPVHAWGTWQVYMRDGQYDIVFLERVFHKLLLNFTWWVNRQDPEGRGVFAGGFLGMDNIGVFDRSRPLPIAGRLEQADGTAWMGFYSIYMLQIAIELAKHNKAYEDVASKFFEHFILIADSLNNIGGVGLWDETDGFYYDQILNDGTSTPMKLRGMVGFVPLFAVLTLREDVIKEYLPDFQKRMHWFFDNRKDLIQVLDAQQMKGEAPHRRLLLSLPTRERLERVLAYMLDEKEFLSPFGVRSLSAIYRDTPYRFEAGGQTFEVRYVPGDMENADFGGNSNWRGPVWVPMNFLIVESLRAYHDFYGDDFQIECPTGSGVRMNLGEVANEIGRRVDALFAGPEGGRPVPDAGTFARFADDPHWQKGILFHEYFDGDTGRGLGSIHQTGWTALVATLLEECPERAKQARAKS